jgi:hypothetical protein
MYEKTQSMGLKMGYPNGTDQRHFEAGNYFQFSRKVRKEFEEWASVGDKFRLLQFNSSSLSLQKLLLILQPFVFVFVKVTTIRSR